MNPIIIETEWGYAQEAKRSARLLYEHGLVRDAISRAYYAVFHAARAALFFRDETPKSHEGVRVLFGKCLVKSGAIEKGWATVLKKQYQYRIDADYVMLSEITAELTRTLIDDAERFVHRIEEYLRANGVELSE